MNIIKRRRIFSKFVAMLVLISIFSIWAMPLTQVNAGEVCCDPRTMNKVTIETSASSEYQITNFRCYSSTHGSVTPLEYCNETLHYKHVIVQCKYCGAIWSNNRVYTGLTHSNPHH